VCQCRFRIFGFIHREVAWEELRARSGLTDRQWRGRLRAFLAEAADRDGDLADQMAARFGLVSRESFEFGLGCLLAGFAARLAGSQRAG
jgi:hypothetical protein